MKIDLHQLKAIVFDFDGVFTNNCVYLNETGEEFVQCDRADGYGISLLRRYISKHKLNIELLVLSTETNSVVSKRCTKLNLECVQGIQNKLDYLDSRYSDLKQGSIFRNILYLGNDLNDIDAMNSCQYSVAPSDAHFQCKQVSDYVLEKKGGNGFVRECIELLLNIPNLELMEISKLLNS